MAILTFYPLGNADCTRIDLKNGRKILVDYAQMRDPADAGNACIDLPASLVEDLTAAKRDFFDVVMFTHLDKDHTKARERQRHAGPVRLRRG